MAKKRRGKKKFLLSLGALIIAGGYAALALTQPLLNLQPNVTYSIPDKTASAVSLAWPDYGEAAVGVPGYGVLQTHGEQKATPTASVAKVMTAVAVLRQYPLHAGEAGPDIVISQADVDDYNSFVAKDGSVVGVALGEHISEYQALQALLLPSANNMADTLARWAFGSIQAYEDYANAYAKQLGLSTVHITDPSGFDVRTVASARDLTQLGMVAILNPVFADIVTQPSAVIPVQGTIYNYNFQLGKGGNIGIKTGNNDGDQGAFMFASKQTVEGQTITVVGTIMDGPDLSTVLSDSRPLIESTAAGFSATTFVKAGQKVATYTVPGQGTIDAVAASDLAFPTWNGMSYSASASLKPLRLKTPAAAQVGAVTTINTSTHVTSSVPVTLQTAAKQPSILWRLKHPLGS